MTFEEFSEKCERRFCLRKSLLSNNCKKESKQVKCYQKWQSSLIKTYEVDEEWNAVKDIVWNRDRGECRLIPKLSADTFILFREKAQYLMETIDFAHYLGRGAHILEKYNPDNVVLLNRYSHSMLDQLKSPITGENITSEQWNYWWEFIIGKEMKNKLDSIKGDKNG
jgi:hypothetical protein